jgi:hypothetical protein
MRLTGIIGPLALAASIVTLSTACSSGPMTGVATAAGTGGASASASAPAAAGSPAKFTQCMRDHGINVPDPIQGRGGAPLKQDSASGVDPNSAAFKAAQSACQQYMPNGGAAPTPDAADLAAERKFAKCMRDHGINIPDPNPDGQLVVGQDQNPQFNPDDPKFQEAQKACQSLLPNGGAPQTQKGGSSA